MLLLRTLSKGACRSAAVFAAGLVFGSQTAWSGVVSEVSAGATLPQPLSSAGDTLNRPTGVVAEGWFETPNFMPSSVEINLALEYLPFGFQNTTSIPLNLNMFGAYAGLTAWGGQSVLGIRPMISGDIGFLYDFLTIPGAASPASNSGTAFAMRIEPGFDLPIVNHLGLVFEFPMTVAFQKTSLAIWESSFALRWKL